MTPNNNGDNTSASSNGMKERAFMAQRNFQTSNTINVTAM